MTTSWSQNLSVTCNHAVPRVLGRELSGRSSSSEESIHSFCFYVSDLTIRLSIRDRALLQKRAINHFVPPLIWHSLVPQMCGFQNSPVSRQRDELMGVSAFGTAHRLVPSYLMEGRVAWSGRMRTESPLPTTGRPQGRKCSSSIRQGGEWYNTPHISMSFPRLIHLVAKPVSSECVALIFIVRHVLNL